MTKGDSPSKSKDFAERLRRLRDEVRHGDGEVEGRGGIPQTAAGWVLRLSVELAAGLLVGGVIGWLLDRWWGTGPLMLILFFLLGATAGLYNVIRAAMELNRAGGNGKHK